MNGPDFHYKDHKSRREDHCLLRDFLLSSFQDFFFTKDTTVQESCRIKDQITLKPQRLLVYIVAPPHLSHQADLIQRMWKRAENFHGAIPAVMMKLKSEDFIFEGKKDSYKKNNPRVQQTCNVYKKLPICLAAALRGAQEEFKEPCLILNGNCSNESYAATDNKGKILLNGIDSSLTQLIFSQFDREEEQKSSNYVKKEQSIELNLTHQVISNKIQHFLKGKYSSVSNENAVDTFIFESLVEKRERIRRILKKWMDHLRWNSDKASHHESSDHNNKCVVVVNGSYSDLYAQILHSLESDSKGFYNITKFPYLIHYGIASVLKENFFSSSNTNESRESPFFGNLGHFEVTFNEYYYYELWKIEAKKAHVINSFNKTSAIDINTSKLRKKKKINQQPGSLVIDLTEAEDVNTHYCLTNRKAVKPIKLMESLTTEDKKDTSENEKKQAPPKKAKKKEKRDVQETMMIQKLEHKDKQNSLHAATQQHSNLSSSGFSTVSRDSIPTYNYQNYAIPVTYLNPYPNYFPTDQVGYGSPQYYPPLALVSNKVYSGYPPAQSMGLQQGAQPAIVPNSTQMAPAQSEDQILKSVGHTVIEKLKKKSNNNMKHEKKNQRKELIKKRKVTHFISKEEEISRKVKKTQRHNLSKKDWKKATNAMVDKKESPNSITMMNEVKDDVNDVNQNKSIVKSKSKLSREEQNHRNMSKEVKKYREITTKNDFKLNQFMSPIPKKSKVQNLASHKPNSSEILQALKPSVIQERRVQKILQSPGNLYDI